MRCYFSRKPGRRVSVKIWWQMRLAESIMSALKHSLYSASPLSAARLKTFLYSLIALLAFAGNSILCRLALGSGAIDASSFTSLRLVSGLVCLAIILSLSKGKGNSESRGSWKSAAMLFLYAVSFSYAYISLDTGTGALILFTSVQITMIVSELLSGTRLKSGEWVGVLLAFSGFVYLMAPGSAAPSFSGFILMAVSGFAWGLYSLAGKRSRNPLRDTSYNFLRTLPLVLVLILFRGSQAEISGAGVLYAILSGALASGAGYAIWYMALRGLTGVQAAVVQLFVPVLATVGGILFAGESLTLRLSIATLLILGGIFVLLRAKYSGELNQTDRLAR